MALREMAWGRSWPIIALSAVAWAITIGFDRSDLVPSLCQSVSTIDRIRSSSFVTTVLMNSSAGQALSCFVMLLAMMTPLIWQPLSHVWDRSLAERRVRAILLFLGGYLGAWMIVMAILALLAVALKLVAGGEIATFAIGVAAAALWQLTPIKARFLRQCHVLRPLPAFGLSADFASFHYGLEIARSCIVACWAIMLLPLISDVAHIPMMGAVAFLMLFERYSAPREVSFPARTQIFNIVLRKG